MCFIVFLNCQSNIFIWYLCNAYLDIILLYSFTRIKSECNSIQDPYGKYFFVNFYLRSFIICFKNNLKPLKSVRIAYSCLCIRENTHSSYIINVNNDKLKWNKHHVNNQGYACSGQMNNWQRFMPGFSDWKSELRLFLI